MIYELRHYQVAGMLGMQELNADEMTRKLEDMLPVIRQVNEQFRDPVSEFSVTESIVLHRICW